MQADNSRYLAQAAHQRHQDTRARADQALDDLARTGSPITIAALASHAGVSRAWIYTQPDLRARIAETNQTTTQKAPTPPSREAATDASNRARLRLAHQRIHELEAENRNLRDQIAQLYGQLRHEKITTPVTDTVHNTENLITPPPQPASPR